MTTEIDETDAKQIYQDLLDQICDAYFQRDFAAFRQAILVPHQYETRDGPMQIDTYEQLHKAFDCFQESMEALGVTDFPRVCTGAMRTGTDCIMGSHTTELLRHGTRLHEPYEVWSKLALVDDTWKVTSSENAISGTSWQARAFGQGTKAQPSA